MIDFAKDDPKVGDVSLLMNGSDVSLHSILGIAAGARAGNAGSRCKNQACLLPRRNCADSRTSPHRRTVERPERTNPNRLQLWKRWCSNAMRPPPPDAAFVKAGRSGLHGEVHVQVDPEISLLSSLRSETPDAGVAGGENAGIPVAGRTFRGRDGYGIAFPDFCSEGPPIILKAKRRRHFRANDENRSAQRPTNTYQVTCKPLNFE